MNPVREDMPARIAFRAALRKYFPRAAKPALAAALLAAAAQAQAGFVTGVVVGHMLTDKRQEQTAQGFQITSDKHDVIICRRADNSQKCSRVWIDGLGYRDLSPAEYAGHSGYKTIYKVGVAFFDGSEYITMEVGK